MREGDGDVGGEGEGSLPDDSSLVGLDSVEATIIRTHTTYQKL